MHYWNLYFLLYNHNTGQTLLAAFIPDAKASGFSARKIINVMRIIVLSVNPVFSTSSSGYVIYEIIELYRIHV